MLNVLFMTIRAPIVTAVKLKYLLFFFLIQVLYIIHAYDC